MGKSQRHGRLPLTNPSIATPFRLRLRLHYKAARVGGVMRIHREGTLIIEIRKAEKADVPAILDLVRGKAEFDGCLNSLQSTEADIEEAFFSEQPKAFALLAMKSGEAVGIATYFRSPESATTKIYKPVCFAP